MAGFDGSGNYVRSYSWVQDASNGINITAARFDTEDNGFGGALSLCVTRDGQGKMTADFLPNADNTLNLGTAIARWKSINGVSVLAISSLAGDVRNYGGISGSDCATAVTSSAAANKEVIFPAGVWVMAATPTIPTGVVLTALPGSSFSGAGAAALGFLTSDIRQSILVEGVAEGAGFLNTQRYSHTYGGAAMTGGRNTLEVQSSLNVASSPSNTNRNYVAGAFQCQANAPDNGTNPTVRANSAGAIFGIGGVAILNAGATSYLNVTAAEFNVSVAAGASVFSRSGIQIAELPSSVTGGAIYDGALMLTGQAGARGWDHGILFCDSSTLHPVTAAGDLIATQGAFTVTNGINFTSYTFTGASFAAKGFTVQGGGTQVDLGIGSSFHQTLHHTSGAASYDTRIVSQSGTGTTGAGTLLFNSGVLGFYDSTVGVAKQTVTGSRGANAALASLLTALAAMKLIVDSSS